MKTSLIDVNCGALVVGLIVYPTGFCIQEFAAMMNTADRQPPIATAQADARCTPRGSTRHPNTHTPRKVDSRKNAARPSIASGAPNTSPTYFE